MNRGDAEPAGTPVLDAAIDRAVRRMVRVDPAPGLRQRVRRQLDGGDEARPFFFAGRLAAAASILGLLIVATALLNRHGAPANPAPAKPATQAATHGATQPDTAARGNGTPTAVPESPANVARDDTHAVTAGRPLGRRRGPHAEQIPLPQVANVFGPPNGTVSGATIAATGAGASGTVASGASEAAPATPLVIPAIPFSPLAVEPLSILQIPAPVERR